MLNSPQRKPSWLHKKLFFGMEDNNIRQIIKSTNTDTICQLSKCPNRGECFLNGEMTFLILGRKCTRNCLFCSTNFADEDSAYAYGDELKNIPALIKKINLKYILITSVCRDDLPDFGSGLFIELVNSIRKDFPKIRIELLIPDFNGDMDVLRKICDLPIDMLSHNFDTVARLHNKIKPNSDFRNSFNILKAVKEYKPNLPIKTGIMVGLGETDREVEDFIYLCSIIGVDQVTIGQYIAPDGCNFGVERYVPPDVFKIYEEWGRCHGVCVSAFPLMRSSYRANDMLANILHNK